ncbi:hypothetical protein RJ641_020951 [Dillenia turbinata]|uniref:Uncharacterized protein n=1 Tax=Dillenia turbinata TaxID=194707 RepID=A0AAN8UDT3_9MAGN
MGLKLPEMDLNGADLLTVNLRQQSSAGIGGRIAFASREGILGPAMYTLFASAIPFGEQLERETHTEMGFPLRLSYTLNYWRPTLASSWSCRTNCSYVYFHVQLCERWAEFGAEAFPSVGWIVWVLFHFLFTRIAGELFGVHIAMLFMQQAVKWHNFLFTLTLNIIFDWVSRGLVDEYCIPEKEKSKFNRVSTFMEVRKWGVCFGFVIWPSIRRIRKSKS